MVERLTIAGGVFLGVLAVALVAAIGFFIWATGWEGFRLVFGVVGFGAVLAAASWIIYTDPRGSGADGVAVFLASMGHSSVARCCWI
jgi:hypothetical protein